MTCRWIVEIVLSFVVLTPSCYSFVVVSSSSTKIFASPTTMTTTPTTLFLENWVADMIDHELYRQNHKKEYENAWMAKNKNAILHSLGGNDPDDALSSIGSSTTSVFEEQLENFRQHNKDIKLAQHDPQRYCADRCVSTGNCDIYEDVYVKECTTSKLKCCLPS
jgi:hypothetical protein